MANDLLVADVPLRHFDDCENQIAEVEAIEFEVWLRMVATAHYLSIMVSVSLDVLDFLFEEEESQIEEEAFDFMIDAVIQALLFEVLLNSVGLVVFKYHLFLEKLRESV